MKKIIFTLIIIMAISLILLPQAMADLNDGLVAYWPFNANANDEGGNDSHGTVHGANLTTDRFGYPDSAYSFDGVDDYISASSDGLPTTNRTVSLWFYADTLSTRPILLGYGGGGCGTSWTMELNNRDLGPAFEVQSHCRVNRIAYFYYNNEPIGAWYHWAVTTDINGTKMYINGIEKAANNNFISNTIVNSTTQLAFGAGVSTYGIAPYTDANGQYTDGKIDDVRIYNRALSNSEILDLFNEKCSFVDVPPGYWAEEHICKIYEAGITNGCAQNPLKFCPKTDVTREQMAAFIVRAVEGEPPANYCATGSPFSDVSSTAVFCKYIKRMSELGITQGCGGDKYCPKTTVTRDQMATFLVRAVEGEPPANYCATGSPFSDVSPSAVFCKYIKRLSELGITKGCGSGNYCPKTTAKRDQMAVFLGRAFLEMD